MKTTEKEIKEVLEQLKGERCDLSFIRFKNAKDLLTDFFKKELDIVVSTQEYDAKEQNFEVQYKQHSLFRVDVKRTRKESRKHFNEYDYYYKDFNVFVYQYPRTEEEIQSVLKGGWFKEDVLPYERAIEDEIKKIDVLVERKQAKKEQDEQTIKEIAIAITKQFGKENAKLFLKKARYSNWELEKIVNQQ